MQAPSAWVHKENERSLGSLGVEKGTGWIGLGKEKYVLKPNSSGSVKGKKTLAHAKALQDNSSGTTRLAKGKVLSLTHHAQDQTALNCDGDQQPWGSSGFKFTTTPYPDLGCQFKGQDHRES